MYLKTFSQGELPNMWTFTIKMLHPNPRWHPSGLVGLVGLVCLNDVPSLSWLMPWLCLPFGWPSCVSICDHILNHDAPHWKRAKTCTWDVEWRWEVEMSWSRKAQAFCTSKVAVWLRIQTQCQTWLGSQCYMYQLFDNCQFSHNKPPFYHL